MAFQPRSRTRRTVKGLADAATARTPRTRRPPTRTLPSRRQIPVPGGLILLGKTTTPEFGWKALTDSPLQGTTRNPWNLTHSPGGSSGGASALTAAGINPFNHGNDGGGSIRIPAAHTGLVGLKPSYGRIAAVPRRLPLRRRHQPGRAGALGARHGDGAEPRRPAPTRATGVRCRPRRATIRSVSTTAYAAGGSASASTSAMSKADPEVRELVAAAARRFEALGAHVEEVGPLFEPLQNSISSRYGSAASPPACARSRPSFTTSSIPACAPPPRRACPSPSPTMRKAFEAKSKLARDLALWHRKYDLLAGAGHADGRARRSRPSTTPEAFPRWTKGAPYTLPCNLTGQPAASMPAGLTKAGLPVGMQIIGAPRADATRAAARCAPTRARAAGPGRSRGSWRR